MVGTNAAPGVALTALSTVTLSDGTSTVTVGPTANFVGATSFQGAGSAFAKAAAVNGAGLQGITASAATSATDTAAFSSIVSGTTTASTYNLTINGQVIYGGTANVALGTTLTGSQVASQINLFSGTTGVTATVGTTGAITLSNTDFTPVVVLESSASRRM